MIIFLLYRAQRIVDFFFTLEIYEQFSVCPRSLAQSAVVNYLNGSSKEYGTYCTMYHNKNSLCP